MKIRPILTTRARFEPALRGVNADEVIAELSALAAGCGGCEASVIRHALTERERLGSTALTEGVAIPHGKIRGLPEVVVVVGLHPQGIPFGSADGEPTRLFVGLLAPDNDPAHHLKVLARLARLLKDPACRGRLMASRDGEGISAALLDADDRVA